MDFPAWQQQLMPEGRHWILNINLHRVFKLQGIELDSLGLGIKGECIVLEKSYFDVQTEVAVELKTKVSFMSRARDWAGMQQQGWRKAKVSERFEIAEQLDRIKLSSTDRQVSIHVHYQGLIAGSERSITMQQYCKVR